MRRLLKAIDAISEWSGRLISFLIYAAIIVLVYEVMMRYLFNAPTIWAHGLTMRFFAAFYIISGAYVLRHRAHITVEVVYERLSLRMRAIADLIGGLFIFIVCGVYLWYGIPYAWESVRILEADYSAWHGPLYPIKVMIVLAGFLLLLQGLAKFSRDLITATTRRQSEY